MEQTENSTELSLSSVRQDTQAQIQKTAQSLMPDAIAAEVLLRTGWFQQPGAYVLADGQYGSTGKGLAEQKLATLAGERVHVVTSNAGPNSGHTIYHEGSKIVTKQLPSFSVASALLKRPIPLFLNAGSILDPKILRQEWSTFPTIPMLLHPHATAILPRHYEPKPSLDLIASTQKGTGPALADKVMRKQFAVAANVHDFQDFLFSSEPWSDGAVIFVSTAQGFSLGLNSGFYPYTTCRECTVQQALADARIPARRLRKVITTHRVHPIRVGSTEKGTSGGWYPDQQEISWESLGVSPELTTVTGRQRRIATWSDLQFVECLRINEPDALFLNFLNYLPTAYDATAFVEQKLQLFQKVRQKAPDFVMLGFGPGHNDVDVAANFEQVGQMIFKRVGGVDIEAVEQSGH